MGGNGWVGMCHEGDGGGSNMLRYKGLLSAFCIVDLMNCLGWGWGVG